ncbi:MAG: hypothetical protein ABJF86_06785 [Tateyamaria sp.]|uniref:hypothetical protein n=1 Tax=Tateyamaria sp. TaxID=1929288 RepID=UPI0032728F82
MAILIGLSIAFALGGLAYLGYEDEIDEARRLAEENDIDLDDLDVSNFSTTAEADADENTLDVGLAPVKEQLTGPTLANTLTDVEPPVAFEPEEEQLVVELDAGVDVEAFAQNVFDPETDTTTLTIGDNTVLSLIGDQTDISVGFGTQAETQNGLSPFDIVLVQNRLEAV